MKLEEVQRTKESFNKDGYYTGDQLVAILHTSTVMVQEIKRRAQDIRTTKGVQNQTVTFFRLDEARELMNEIFIYKAKCRTEEQDSDGSWNGVEVSAIKDRRIRQMILVERRVKATMIGKRVTVLHEGTERVGRLTFYNMAGFGVDYGRGEVGYVNSNAKIKEVEEWKS